MKFKPGLIAALAAAAAFAFVGVGSAFATDITVGNPNASGTINLEVCNVPNNYTCENGTIYAGGSYSTTIGGAYQAYVKELNGGWYANVTNTTATGSGHVLVLTPTPGVCSDQTVYTLQPQQEQTDLDLGPGTCIWTLAFSS